VLRRGKSVSVSVSVISYYYWYSALGPVWAETRTKLLIRTKLPIRTKFTYV